MGLVQLKVEAVALDYKGNPLVVLREDGGTRAIFIWVGLAEATAISMQLEGQPARRPMTHDLIMLLLKELAAKVSQVMITDMQVDTYFAELELQVGDRRATIDCRPSDAIAVALGAKAPILIDDGLLDRLEKTRRESEEAIPESTIVDTGEMTVH